MGQLRHQATQLRRQLGGYARQRLAQRVQVHVQVGVVGVGRSAQAHAGAAQAFHGAALLRGTVHRQARSGQAVGCLCHVLQRGGVVHGGGDSALGQQAQRGDAGEEVRAGRVVRCHGESRSIKFKHWY